MNKKEILLAVFTGFTGAYDSIWWCKLLHKMQNTGTRSKIPGNLSSKPRFLFLSGVHNTTVSTVFLCY
jgi:hypothetical protein